MDNKVKIKYLAFDCHSCGIPIMVNVNRTSARNYCQTCAWSKLGETNYGISMA